MMCGERLWLEQPNVPGVNVLIAVCAKGQHVAEADARVYRDNGQTVLAKITWVR